MPELNNTPDTGSSIYDSGASNLDILESVGNSLIDEQSPAADATTAGAGGGDDSSASGAAASEGVGGAAGGQSEVRPEWFEQAPAEFKALIDHKNISADAKKWLEQTYDELNGFRTSPIGTREAVTEVAELFPGGIEDMRVAHENSDAYAREMEQFRSGDPSQQGELLANLLQDPNGPEPFLTMASTALEMIKDALPRDYAAIASDVTRGHLEEMTDGKYASFFDSVRDTAAQYQAKVDAGDEAGAARLASKLGGFALQMSDWWGTARGKLGFDKGQKPVDGGSVRPMYQDTRVDKMVPDNKDISYAQRDAAHFQTNYIMHHDQLVQPLVQQALTRDLAVRKMEIPDTWKRDVQKFVENGIKNNLGQDKQYLALERRVYKRGSEDPRRWDFSPNAEKILLNSVRSRAQALVPTLIKQALDRISEIRGGGAQKNTADPASRNRGAGGPATGGGAGNAGWESELKEGKISSVDAIQRMAGVA